MAKNIYFSSNFRFFLLELERKPDENIREILQMAQGSVHDIDFVLRREWIAPGSEPKSLSESNNSGNKESDLDGVNNFRVNCEHYN